MVTVIADTRQIRSADMAAAWEDAADIRCHAADRMRILPCRGCGSCSGKTFGRCVLRDDMAALLKDLAASRVLILLSPIVYGGYSAAVKRALDRSCTMGDPHYAVRNGELVKGMRGALRHVFAIGVAAENTTEEEAQAFVQLHCENVAIMNVAGRAYICRADGLAETIGTIREVIQHETAE